MDTRHTIQGLLLAVGLLFLYLFIVNRLFPTQPPVKPRPAVETPFDAAPAPATASAPTSTQPATGAALAFAPAGSRETRVVGGREQDALRLEFTPVGAAVESAELRARDAKGRLRHKLAPKDNEPYRVFEPITIDGRTYFSFATHRLWIQQRGAESWALDELVWSVESATPDGVVFAATLRDTRADRAVLTLRKRYELVAGKPLINFTIDIENQSDEPQTVVLAQDGPLGIIHEGYTRDVRRVMAAQYKDGAAHLAHTPARSQLASAAKKGETVPLTKPDAGAFLWTALTDKYFGVFTRPLAETLVKSVVALTPTTTDAAQGGDLLARMTTAPLEIPAKHSMALPFEIYIGAKDSDELALVNPAFVDSGKLGYSITQMADLSCACTFQPLPQLMTKLLRGIHFVVRNYGVAIIVMVIIIRTLLHPLSVFQQKSMYRMQEAMGKLQPKMAAIKEKYANDKARQSQEMFKLFSEENVNPAGNFVAFIPMFIQMPILVALWVALSTDVQLRHAAFDGWWISDLSAPDALIRFSTPITIPILGQLPLLSYAFSNIPSINLLPILMGVSMYLQQKYMPKPHQQARADAAKQASQERKPGGGMTPEEQLRQQQMVANMMSVMFPIMFYYMPAGLNLYWMATNVYGICESLLIRRQIAAEKKRRELEGPAGPAARATSKPGVVARWLKRMAEQYEHLQRKADELSDAKKKP